MNLTELRALKPQILAIAEQYGVSNIRVFGSVARGDAGEDSDVDLFIDLQERSSLFDLFRFKAQMEKLCGRKVDTVQVEAVKNRLRKKYMLQHVVPL